MTDENARMEDGEDIGEPVGDGVVGTPRWVKTFGIVTATVILLFVIVLLLGGDHGPARHSSPAGVPTSSAGARSP